MSNKKKVNQLIVGVCNGNKNKVAKHLNEKTVNQQDQNGLTPLMWAAIMRNNDMFNLLLQFNPDLNLVNNSGDTVLTIVAKTGDEKMLSALLAFDNINVNHREEEGNTAVMIASKLGHLENVRHLIKKGAVLDIQNYYGKTAFAFSEQENQSNLILFYTKNSHLLPSEDYAKLKTIKQKCVLGVYSA